MASTYGQTGTKAKARRVNPSISRPKPRHNARLTPYSLLMALAALVMTASAAFAHDVTPGDAGYIQEIWGVHIVPFIYLGAKHMITGYDHILFLLGVVFFLYRMKDVALYVSLFALGHSITMLLGVGMAGASTPISSTPLSACPSSIRRWITLARSRDGWGSNPTPRRQR